MQQQVILKNKQQQKKKRKKKKKEKEKNIHPQKDTGRLSSTHRAWTTDTHYNWSWVWEHFSLSFHLSHKAKHVKNK